jgi:phasin family protein
MFDSYGDSLRLDRRGRHQAFVIDRARTLRFFLRALSVRRHLEQARFRHRRIDFVGAIIARISKNISNVGSPRSAFGQLSTVIARRRSVTVGDRNSSERDRSLPRTAEMFVATRTKHDRVRRALLGTAAHDRFALTLTSLHPEGDHMAKPPTSNANGLFDLAKMFGDFRLPGVGVEDVLMSQRKHFEALTQANQLTLECARTVTQRQAEIMQQVFAEGSALFQLWMQPAAPQERLVKNIEVVRRTFEKSVTDAREIAELVMKANSDAFDLLGKRAAEAFDEASDYAKRRLANGGERLD